MIYFHLLVPVSQLVRQFLPLEAPECARLALVELVHGVEDPLGRLLCRHRGLPVLGRSHVRLDPAGVDAGKDHVLHFVGEGRGEHVQGGLGTAVGCSCPDRFKLSDRDYSRGSWKIFKPSHFHRLAFLFQQSVNFRSLISRSLEMLR